MGVKIISSLIYTKIWQWQEGEKAKESLLLSKEAKDALENITESIDKVSEMNNHIATAASEQSTVVAAVNTTIQGMVSLSTTNAVMLMKLAFRLKA